ncbi:tape measure protein [Listeria monocytogenes]|uniref:phage tail protein n=1 Tax=Listeria monocytogenes TaxID=1639 RepID=UPI0011EB08F5|nr:tape measure protein [Listeria monocytogenes]TYU88924.1 tape measure protein [Listeria monocytogenes]
MGEIFKLFGTIGIDNKKVMQALNETEKKGETTAGKLSHSFFKVAKKIGKVMSITATGVTTALAGIALKKGWSRLIGIDDARAKLMGLGHDAKSVDAIMASALESVKGTSFGMDEAATTAANAVAAGIKPGQALTKYLKTTADAAAVAGVSMGDMGSIFNKVQTGQRAYTRELEQLSDRGLPIYQWLGEEAGVAADKVKDMASKGQISAEMFMAAIDKNIGGAAKIMGEASFSASLKNMGAAIGRIGANFLDAGGKGGGFFSQIKPLIPKVTALLGGLETKASDFGVLFGQVFSKAVNFVSNLGNHIQSFSQSGFVKNLQWAFKWIGEAITNTIQTVQQEMPAFKQLFSDAGSRISVIFTKLAGVFSSWSATFSDIFQFLVPRAIDIFKSAFNTVNTVVLPIIEQLIDVFWEISGVVGETIVNTVLPAIDNFTKAITKNKALFSTLKAIVVGVGSAFVTYKGIMKAYTTATKIASNVTKAYTAVQKIFNAVMNTNPFVLIVTAIVGLVAAFIYLWNTNEDFRNKVIEIWNTVKDTAVKIFKGIADFIKNVWDSIVEKTTSLKDGIVNIFNGIKNFLQTVWNVIYAVVGAIIVNIINVWKGIFDGFKAYFQYLWDLIKAIATGVWEKIGGTVMTIINGYIAIWKAIFNGLKAFFGMIWNAIKTTISNVVQAILNFVTPIFNTMKNTITNIFNAIRNTASTVWNSIKSVVSSVVQAIKNVVVSIFNALKNTVTNIFNGIRNIASTVWNSIKTTVSTIVNAIVNTVKNLFNNLKNAVSSIWDGIRNTISNVVNTVKNTISNVWSSISGTVSGIFNSVKNAIEGPMNAAKNIVKTIIDAIKGFFSFNISWPKIPLPHFSINPAGWHIGDLLKGKIPSLGIDWHAKGGIFDQPTLLGGRNQLHGVGEAGAEAVAPIDTLMDYVEKAVQNVLGENKEGDINVTQYITSPEPLTPRELARETKFKLQDLAVLRK